MITWRSASTDEAEEITVHQNIDERSGAIVSLTPPYAGGPLGDKIILRLDGEVVFTPSPELGLERHLSFWTEPPIDGEKRRALDAIAGWTSQRSDVVIYLAPGTQLTGRFEPAPHRSASLAVSMGAIFFVVLGVLGVAYQRMSKAAARERADRILEARFVELGGSNVVE